MAEGSKGSDAWLGAAEGMGGVPCPNGSSFDPVGDKARTSLSGRWRG